MTKTTIMQIFMLKLRNSQYGRFYVKKASMNVTNDFICLTYIFGEGSTSKKYGILDITK